LGSNAGIADIFANRFAIGRTGVGMQAACGMMSQKLQALGAAVALAAISACAAPTSYMGVELAPVAAASSAQAEIQSLARRAQAGDKQAQLELGIRFEEGRGVPIDLKKARKLYAKAGADSGGTIWVYSPPVGNGSSGRVIPVKAGPKQSGLAEARERLEGLE
jgi:hypothetical protein